MTPGEARNRLSTAMFTVSQRRRLRFRLDTSGLNKVELLELRDLLRVRVRAGDVGLSMLDEVKRSRLHELMGRCRKESA